MKNLLIIASGSGTNAENLEKYFKNSLDIRVKLIATNNPKAGVIERMMPYNVPILVFSRSYFYSNSFIDFLKENSIDYIVLAGFLWLVPENLIAAFPNRIINIHPSLLPKYGGKGMYGMKVHEKVIENKEAESGISIHLVNEDYDKGKILYQAKCKVLPEDSPDELAKKVHALEYEYFPKAIEEYILAFN